MSKRKLRYAGVISVSAPRVITEGAKVRVRASAVISSPVPKQHLRLRSAAIYSHNPLGHKYKPEGRSWKHLEFGDFFFLCFSVTLEKSAWLVYSERDFQHKHSQGQRSGQLIYVCEKSDVDYW